MLKMLKNIFLTNYLDDRNVEGLRVYKYSSIDDSPVSIHCLQPVYSRLIKCFPLWLHPNIMTLAGGFCVVLSFLFMASNFDSANGISLIQNKEFGQKSFVLISLLMFLAHHLDGMDGVQARRLKFNSPIGEILDHGIDSVDACLVAYCVYMSTGYTELFPMIILFSTIFIVPHWEKKYTGTFFLPWGYDIAMFSCFIWYTFIAIFSNYVQLFETTPLVQLGLLLLNLSALCQSICVSIQGIFRVIRKFKEDGLTGRNLWLKVFFSLLELLPFVLTSILFHIWFKYSPNNIGYKQMSLFLWTYSIIFSHVTFHMILSSITGHNLPKCRFFSQCSLDVNIKGASMPSGVKNGSCFVSGLIFTMISSFVGGYSFGEYFEVLCLKLFSLLITMKHFHFITCLFIQLVGLYGKSFIFVN